MAKIMTRSVLEVSGKEIVDGIECKFFKLDKSKGLKIYPSEREASYNHKGQIKLAKHGLSPKILCDVKIVIFKNKIYWGFLTELAKTGNQRNGLYNKEIETIKPKLKQLGFGGDIKPSNFGVIKGKLVLIDCGYYSRTKR